MKIYKSTTGILIESNGNIYVSKHDSWDSFINQDNLYKNLEAELAGSTSLGGIEVLKHKIIQAPIQNQEIWAAGVTYTRSRDARMEESKDTGGGNFYDKVYDALRPELFFKATPHRIVGHGAKVNIRKDSAWDVPEPELTLVVTSSGKIIGYTIGNDMSSRSIEGENPLYLPQAKTYDACAAVGPCVYVTEETLSPKTMISIDINRNNKRVFEGSVEISQMKRSVEELVSFVYRECSFPNGCLIMTGTGIVPGNDFTLQKGDAIKITIEGIGELVNEVA